jgi:drug/metabolite transporter (DMT)-like permease
MLFYVSISMAVLSSLLYHVILKFTPSDVNPAISLAVTYAVAVLVSLALLPVFPLSGSILGALKELNWASYALALALVGLEVSFLLAYRAGWNISTAALLVNVAVTLLVLPIGVLALKESLSIVNAVGVLVCLAGLLMINVGK